MNEERFASLLNMDDCVIQLFSTFIRTKNIDKSHLRWKAKDQSLCKSWTIHILYKELISQIAVAIWLNFKEMPTEACVLFNLSSIVLIFHSKYSNVLNFRLKDLHVLLRKKCLLRNCLEPISILWKSFRSSDYEYILERYVNICESSAFIIVNVCECHVYFQGKSMWKCTHI